MYSLLWEDSLGTNGLMMSMHCWAGLDSKIALSLNVCKPLFKLNHFVFNHLVFQELLARRFLLKTLVKLNAVQLHLLLWTCLRNVRAAFNFSLTHEERQWP